MERWTESTDVAAKADWNVIVTLPEKTFREACRLLGKWGKVKRTSYYNVLAMTVEDPDRFLDQFAAAVAETPGILNYVSHVVPAQQAFDFDSPEDFEARAQEIARRWAPRLTGASFHVRLHRRGFKGRFSSPREERLLDDTLLAALVESGTPGHISFEDPDAIVQIETIDGRAGMSLWGRDDLRRYPFLGAD